MPLLVPACPFIVIMFVGGVDGWQLAGGEDKGEGEWRKMDYGASPPPHCAERACVTRCHGHRLPKQCDCHARATIAEVDEPSNTGRINVTLIHLLATQYFHSHATPYSDIMKSLVSASQIFKAASRSTVHLIVLH